MTQGMSACSKTPKISEADDQIGPAPAGRGWDQGANNFGGPGMPAQGFPQGNAAGYGRGQPMSPSGNWDQANSNFNGAYQA